MGLSVLGDRADSDHEEFVHIALVYGREREPFEKRVLRSDSFIYDTFIEFKPGKLSVFEILHNYLQSCREKVGG